MILDIFDVIQFLLELVSVFFVCYLIGYSSFLFFSVVIGSSSLYKKRQQEELKNILSDNYYIPISIIVPAYNEEVTVVDTVKSLLSLDYCCYEIIVVDDGSSDDTSKKLINEFNLQQTRKPIAHKIKCQAKEKIYESLELKVPLTLIRKKNGGKADSLNMGINAAKYPYFICMDADSVLQYDSLVKISRPILENNNVVAVGGVVRPANGASLKNGKLCSYKMPNNIIACMQTLEYDRSFLASRILLDKINGSLIISGAFGLFKKETVIAAGGYDPATVGEDMELVVKLHEYCVSTDCPYVIKYASDAICWSQVPENLHDLCKQRKRWHIGLFQSMWSHKKMMFNLKYGAVSLVSYLYFLLYELFSPFIELFGIITMIIAFCVDLINIPFMLLFFAIYAVFGAVLSLTAFFSKIYSSELKISFLDAIKAIGLSLLEIIGLRFILSVVRMSALGSYSKNKKAWGKIKRKKIDFN